MYRGLNSTSVYNVIVCASMFFSKPAVLRESCHVRQLPSFTRTIPFLTMPHLYLVVFRQHGVDNDAKADRGKRLYSTRSQLFSETEVVYSIIYSLDMEVSQRLFFHTAVLWIIVSAGIKGHRGYAVIFLYSDLAPPRDSYVLSRVMPRSAHTTIQI